MDSITLAGGRRTHTQRWESFDALTCYALGGTMKRWGVVVHVF